MKDEFLKQTQDTMETLGFWTETYRATVIKAVEEIHTKEITDKWRISDIVPSGNLFLIKWTKRFGQ